MMRSRNLQNTTMVHQVLPMVAIAAAYWMGLPATAMPVVEVIQPKGPAHAEKPYSVEYRVKWDGAPSDYQVLPPEWDEQLGWGRIELDHVSTQVEGNSNVISQHVKIVPYQAGSFTVPEARIGIETPREGREPPKSPTPNNPNAPSKLSPLRAPPFPVEVSPRIPLAEIFGGIGILLLCVGLGWLYVRHRRAKPAQPNPSSRPDTLSNARRALQQARAFRLSGQDYQYYQELSRAVEFLAASDSDWGNALTQRAARAGYAAVRPTKDEMDSDWRAVERAIEQQKEEAPA